MSNLGSAFVQIVPSAEGITGSIANVLGAEADSAGKATGSRLVDTIKGVIVAAGIGKALMASINEGAALQQSLGGIETLYKGSADRMKQYANDAFVTTGLSANAYMENVTGFSASLLSSLKGDTEAAAEAANTAMIDMADNSNKMGTSMESIQMAYQGFDTFFLSVSATHAASGSPVITGIVTPFPGKSILRAKRITAEFSCSF